MRAKIFELARRRGYAEDHADDIVQDVVTVFTIGREDTAERAWDGAGDPVKAAYRIARNVIWVRRRREKRAPKERAARDDEEAHDASGLDEGEPPPSSQSSPEHLTVDKRFRELLDVLRPVLDAALEDDAKALGVVRLWRAGVVEGAELARLLEATDSEIKEAKARIERALIRAARPYADEAREGFAR